MYKSAYIEEAIIGRNISNTDSKDVSHSHSCNNEDHYFDYQLDQWGIEKLFQSSDEVIIRELKLFVEDREMDIKNKIQLSRTMFFAKYVRLALYDEDLDKIFIIDHEQLQFDRNSG